MHGARSVASGGAARAPESGVVEEKGLRRPAPAGVTSVNPYRLSHLSDSALVRDLKTLVAEDCATTAALLAHLAEVDARRLYLPAAYPSMFAYCLGELGFSEDTAYKRIRAARAAQRFPALFMAVANGRLHLTAVVLLAPYLTAANAEELMEAAAGKRRAEVEELLAKRFPRSELLPLVEGLPAAPREDGQLAPGPVRMHIDSSVPERTDPLALGNGQLALGPVRMQAGSSVPERTDPLAPGDGQLAP